MINAAMARSYAFKSVGIVCHADAMKNLYDAIDEQIERDAKDGKMSSNLYLDKLVEKHIKAKLSFDQLKALSEEISSKYVGRGFKVSTKEWTSFCYGLDITIGWFSL